MRRDAHDRDDPARRASCGRPVRWVDLTLLDDDGNRVPQGEPGEICVRAPLVMKGYHDMPEETAEAFHDGWMHTGDVAREDEHGFLTIVDRKKDKERKSVGSGKSVAGRVDLGGSRINKKK